MEPTRRTILRSLLLAPPVLLGAGTLSQSHAQSQQLPLTPSCGEDFAPTIRQTAGPYYRPDAPIRRNMAVDAVDRQRVTLLGYVLDQECRPIPGAEVEIWHANEHGDYDNDGYDWRARQITDRMGRWGFDTIVTEHYSFRTAHYHFRVVAPGSDPLITQLYFPDHPLNAADRLFDPRLVLDLDPTGALARFDFVVQVG
ncbi:catechol 1,2-dioxygenase [Aurantimonas endophytica]|uniref:Protocatechuate 3,4-dioxygenase beta subunit n=1 Tax=Aurantimonas endophytica TaxID=1522175 RepID=A0A7W6HHX5_9HYPH|nr:catechol 1,2-dioxygenase [Aurantimonas endophytica]MBB4005542.1 protocatechuate 3,4-dioxygenase beta subunit [Aurantimonas endophytica]MCO6406486.1 catechol 1,2-dioxygenase [Aurantimonas endophytica]